jgi:uncharacterized protein affecting Mg2+/Co2+ transport
LHALNSDTTTNGIRIQVSVLYFPESSAEGNHLFAYRVTISCVSPTLRRCRLTTRTWRCTDGDEPASVVSGAGVIGQYPEMYPGAPDFVYESCTQLNHETGSIEGEFQFEDAESGTRFDAAIGAFHFDTRLSYT